MPFSTAEILVARDPDDLEGVRTLFRDYQAFLGVDLCFQGFEDELASLPGAYGPPVGSLLLAWGTDGTDRRIAGGVAVRPLKGGPADVCEMKRLYVRDAWKGQGLGRKLAEAIMLEARKLGYRRMVLDTLGRLESALALYEKLGFYKIDPYYENPISGVVYLECVL